MKKLLLILLLVPFLMGAGGLDENVNLLLRFDIVEEEGVTITDATTEVIEASGAHLPSNAGDSYILNNRYKWGNSSSHFDGSTGYFSIADNADWDVFGSTTGNYTVDFWFYMDNLNAERYFFNHYENTPYWYLRINAAKTITIKTQDTDIDKTSTATVGHGWNHMALIRVAGDVGVYLNGTQIIDDDLASGYDVTGTMYIGAWAGSSGFMDGYMDEIRFQSANPFGAAPVAGLTDTITVPTAAHTSDGSTELLLSFDGDYSDDTGTHTVTSNARTSVSSELGDGVLALDDTGDYVSVPDAAAFDFGTGDFTVEAWVRVDTSTPASNEYWTNRDTDGTDNKLRGFVALTTGYPTFILNTTTYSGTTDISDGLWHHLAFVRESGSVDLYVDGTSEASGSNSYSISWTDPWIVGAYNSGFHFFDGYIDEFRVSDNARYSTNFTPSTTPFADDANTVFLLHFDTHDVSDDGGGNNAGHTVYFEGDAQVDTTTVEVGDGALQLDGTGDYLQLPDSADWDVGGDITEDWTISAWVKHDVHTAVDVYLQHYEDATNRWVFRHSDSDGGLQFYIVTGGVGVVNMTGVAEISDTNWHHVTLVKIGDATTPEWAIYKDGVQVDYLADNSTDTFAGSLEIGRKGDGTNYLDGYIDDILITESNYFEAYPNADNTDTIAPQGETYTVIGTDTGGLDSNTKLLLSGDQNSFGLKTTDGALEVKDGAGHHVLTQNGDVDIQTSVVKIGNGAVEFDGTGDYLSSPDSDDWTCFDGDCTVEFWVYFTNATGFQHFFAQRASGDWNEIFLDGTSNYLYLKLGDGASSTNEGHYYATWNPSDSQWYHVAVVRDGSTCRMFIDGTALSVTEDVAFSSPTNHSSNFAIGIDQGDSDYELFGYIDEYRVSHSARYTTNFTPHTTPHELDADTRLLINGEPQDQSDSLHIASYVGDAKVETQNKKFGWGSYVFDGTGDYITFPDSNDWNIWNSVSEDYTVDFWYKLDTIGGNTVDMFIQHNDNTTNNNDAWGIYNWDAGNVLCGTLWTGGTKVADSCGAEETDTTSWHHLALVIVGGGVNNEIALYRDGTQISYLSDSDIDNFIDILAVGSDAPGSWEIDGQMDEVRIQNSNYFSASPNATPDDTITVPDESYSVSAATRRIFFITKRTFTKRKDGKGFDRKVESWSQNFGWNGIEEQLERRSL